MLDEIEVQDDELMDLGDVSEETKGSFFGHSWDGGFGVRLP